MKSDDTSGGTADAELVRLLPSTEVNQRLEAAQTHQRADNHRAALDLLDRTIAEVPATAQAHLLRGESRRVMGDTNGALDDAERACTLQPTKPGPLLLRASVLSDLGQVGRALTDVHAAMEKASAAATWMQAGRLLVLLGDDDGAIEAFSQSFQTGQHMVAALQARGAVYMGQGCFVAALADFSSCCAMEAGLAQHWVNRGNAFYELGEFELAIRDYEIALDLEPALPEVSLNLGCIALDEDEIEVAIRHFGRALQLEPDSPRAYLNRGLAYYYRQMDDSAEADLRQAIVLDPDDADAYFGLARLLARQARYAQSAEQLEHALQRCPEYVEEVALDDVFEDLRKLKSVKRMMTIADDLLS